MPEPRKKAVKKKPTVELYLKKINQEMIRHRASAAGCDFYASWSKECCILDFAIIRPGDLVSRPMRGLILRKEPGGGMMWYPRTGAVYKLNEEAYHALMDLESGLSDLEIARRNNLEVKSVRTLVTRLRKIAS